jgi:predicted PurR-regulated permease PerM
MAFSGGRLFYRVFIGVSAFSLLFKSQVPYALVLAAIAGVFDLIPGIGATLGISLVALILLPQGFWLSLKVLVSCILLQQVEEIY